MPKTPNRKIIEAKRYNIIISTNASTGPYAPSHQRIDVIHPIIQTSRKYHDVASYAWMIRNTIGKDAMREKNATLLNTRID